LRSCWLSAFSERACYTNLAKLSALKGKTALIQYSALLTSSRRVALAARNLAAHYGAKTTVVKVMGTDL
jgi:hypothetical protein